MNQLIKLSNNTIGNESLQTINARELHGFLEVKSEFRNWIKNRIDDFGFVENHDFVTVGKNLPGGGRQNDYHMTLDMAKELSMVERNEKGKEARQYFIECERASKSAPIDPMQMLSDPAAMRGLLLTYTEKVLLLENKVDELTPKAHALDLISADKDTLTLTEVAKILGVKLKELTARLHAEGWVYRLNGAWVAYDRYIKNKCLEYKEANFTDEKTGLGRKKPYCHVTPKGLTKLAQMYSVELEPV